MLRIIRFFFQFKITKTSFDMFFLITPQGASRGNSKAYFLYISTEKVGEQSRFLEAQLTQKRHLLYSQNTLTSYE